MASFKPGSSAFAEFAIFFFLIQIFKKFKKVY